MKLVAKIKLLPTPEQRVLLLAVMERMNLACNWLAAKAAESGVFKQYDLHDLHYFDLRNEFGISSQMAVRVIAKVADSFKTGKVGKPREFNTHGAVPFDARIYTFKSCDTISILTLDGRVVTPFVAAGPHVAYLKGAKTKGEADLILRRGKWYFHISVEVAEAPWVIPVKFLGVDLGVVNLATDSDGVMYSGADVEIVRRRNLKIRSELQRCGSRSARRHLKKIGDREARFRENTNHIISKSLVCKAKDTHRVIVLEDLTYIRDRITVPKAQRARLGGWAFRQLREFTKYKARKSGVIVVFVDPRDTSRRCLQCRYTDKANRKSQTEFVCRECGYAANADFVGAINIARKAFTAYYDVSRATVNWPVVSSDDTRISSARVAQKQASASASVR